MSGVMLRISFMMFVFFLTVRVSAQVVIPYAEDFENGDGDWKKKYVGWEYGDTSTLNHTASSIAKWGKAAKLGANESNFWGVNPVGSGGVPYGEVESPIIRTSKTANLKFSFTYYFGEDVLNWLGGAPAYGVKIYITDGTKRTYLDTLSNPTKKWVKYDTVLVTSSNYDSLSIGFVYDRHAGAFGFDDLTVGDTVIKKDTAVAKITVQGKGGVSVISEVGKTLQMEATVLPLGATNKMVAWSVSNGSGTGSIDSNGLLTGTGAGEVYVKATATDGSGISGVDTITIKKKPVTTTSVEMKKRDHSSLSVYPNPVYDQATIFSETGETYLIYGIDGSVMLKGRLVEQHTKLDLSGLSKGVYWLRVNEQVITVVKD